MIMITWLNGMMMIRSRQRFKTFNTTPSLIIDNIPIKQAVYTIMIAFGISETCIKRTSA